MTPSGLLAAWLCFQLGVSALHKLLDPERARGATARLLGPLAALTRVATPAAALVEAVSAAALLTPGWTAIGATGAAAIWLIYAGAASAAWLAGEQRFDCGCTFGGRDRPGDIRLVAARAATMAALALLLLATGAEPVWRDLPAMAAASGFSALAFAAAQLRQNRQFQGSLAA